MRGQPYRSRPGATRGGKCTANFLVIKKISKCCMCLLSRTTREWNREGANGREKEGGWRVGKSESCHAQDLIGPLDSDRYWKIRIPLFPCLAGTLLLFVLNIYNRQRLPAFASRPRVFGERPRSLLSLVSRDESSSMRLQIFLSC